MSDFRSHVNTVTIATSEFVTAPLGVPGYASVGAGLPVLTSCTLTVEVGPGPNSGDTFHPLDGVSYTSETGSKAIVIADIETFPYMRFRSSAAQAGARHILVYGKGR